MPVHGTLMPRILPPGCAPELHILAPPPPGPGTDRHPIPQTSSHRTPPRPPLSTPKITYFAVPGNYFLHPPLLKEGWM